MKKFRSDIKIKNLKKFFQKNCFFPEKSVRFYLKNGRQCSDEMTLRELLDSYEKYEKVSNRRGRNAH